ncbi:MAG: acylphosphatase [Chloroflexota bacterium]
MNEANKRLHAIVSGRVQGVSFRYHTTLEAKRLNITGWVYNRPDRTVEVIAEGDESTLKDLEAWLYEGSPAAKVTGVDTKWDEATGEFDTFKTVYRKVS